jgi:hypothetical protein
MLLWAECATALQPPAHSVAHRLLKGTNTHKTAQGTCHCYIHSAAEYITHSARKALRQQPCGLDTPTVPKNPTNHTSLTAADNKCCHKKHQHSTASTSVHDVLSIHACQLIKADRQPGQLLIKTLFPLVGRDQSRPPRLLDAASCDALQHTA